ncbi:MAG: aminotransferase class III-fold pyridoxal phosphate-dependent enzyme [Nevskiaceae bacterium]|jgi:acetylornithine/succinyldiaminopimelate/putrescine aminotransferase|nr:aminotransferase class III-fold pyridoxal phosphate-dependent enzyme [Nevskiaceae bacterium]
MNTAHAQVFDHQSAHDAHDPLAPVFAQYPLDVVRAEGVWLYAANGRRVLDLYGGHAVAALGYDHPAWTKALTAQAHAVNFQSNAVPMDVRTRAAQKLIAFSKLPVQSVFFVNSGAEANENALKMAFTLNPGRTEVVALEQSFHGRTAGAGALTWGAATKWYGFPRTPFDVTFLPRRDESALARITEKTAAVFVEPIQGVGGAFDLGAAYLKALRKRCDETGAVLVFDEVQCGFGRCGEPFAAVLYDVLPDMITSAKALGNGFPCSALLMMKKAADAVKLDSLGTTFGGGPMAAAAIEACIDAIDSEQLLANVRQVSAYIRNTCVVGPIIGTQGEGFLTGLISNKPAKDLQKALLEQHDILTGTSGDPNVLRLLPPFILRQTHVDLLAAALKRLS